MRGKYFAKVSRFRSGQTSEILTKTVSPPLTPRHRQKQNVRPWCYEDLDQCIHVHVVSFQSSSLWCGIWLYQFLIIAYLFTLTLTALRRTVAVCWVVATVFQSHNGRQCLSERGIVQINASPECIMSFPGTAQSAFVSARQILRRHSVRYCREWVRVCGFVWAEAVAPPQHHRNLCKDDYTAHVTIKLISWLADSRSMIPGDAIKCTITPTPPRLTCLSG